MLKGRRALLIVLFSALCIAVPGLLTAQAQAPTLVIHENPASLDNIKPFDVNGRMMLELEHMFGSLDLAALNISAADFNGSRLRLQDFDQYYRTFKGYLGQADLNASQFQLIIDQADLTAADLRAMINSSEAYEANLTLFNDYWARGDTMDAMAAAADLQTHFGAMNHTTRQLTDSATAIDRMLQNTGVDTNRLIAGVSKLNEYTNHVAELNRQPMSLLGNTNLTLYTYEAGAGTGDTVMFFARLTSGDGGVYGEPISLYVNGEPAVNATTDGGGSCVFYYTVRGGSFADTLNAIAYYDPHGGNYTAAVSSNVQLRRHPITPALTINVSPRVARFGDTLRVQGTLTADGGYPVPGHPVAILLPGRAACVTTTLADGYYASDVNITATVESGLLEVRATYVANASLHEALVNGSSPGAPVQVSPQGTTLALEPPPAAIRGGENVTFAGTLASADGRPVEGEEVSVYAGATRLGDNVTDASGRYNLTMALPYNLTAGVWPVYATYRPADGTALYGSQSDGYDVALVAAPPTVRVYGVPIIAFQGDVLDLLVNVTANGAPVAGNQLEVGMPGVTLDRNATDGYGNLFTANRIEGWAGLQTITVSTTPDGLLEAARVTGGVTLIMPFDMPTSLAAAIAVLLVAGLAVTRVTDIRRRLPRRPKGGKQPLLKPTLKVTPLTLPPAGPGGKPPLTGFDDEIARINGVIKGGADRRTIIAEIYLAVRRIAAGRGVALPDSATHREFFEGLSQREPELAAPAGTIVQNYEAAVFGRLSPDEQDVVNSLYSLKEIDGHVAGEHKGGAT